MHVKLLLFCSLIGTQVSTPILADEKVGIKGGGAVVGTVNPTEKFVEINVAPGIRVAVDTNKADITKEERPEEAEYQSRIEKLSETAEAHWEMYQWCKPALQLMHTSTHGESSKLTQITCKLEPPLTFFVMEKAGFCGMT